MIAAFACRLRRFGRANFNSEWFFTQEDSNRRKKVRIRQNYSYLYRYAKKLVTKLIVNVLVLFSSVYYIFMNYFVV